MFRTSAATSSAATASTVGTTARRVVLAGVAAATLLGLAACEPQSAVQGAAAVNPTAVATAPGPTSTTGGGVNSNTTPAAGGSATTPAAAPAKNGTPACDGSQIKVTTKGDGVAMSHAGLTLIFTNTGNGTCSLSGYPGADLSDVSGPAVPSADLWDATRTMIGYLGGAAGYSTPPTVVLTPGESGSALLEWSDMPQGGGAMTNADCPGESSVQLLITPPNTKTTATFATSLGACQGFEIHPVVPGTAGTSQG